MFNYREIDSKTLEYVIVGDESDLPAGERIFVQIDDLDIVIFNLAGAFFAIADLCTHDNGPLGEGEVEDSEVICPRHGARFDLHTGKAKTLPAVVDIPAYPVRLVGGRIEIGIPVEE